MSKRPRIESRQEKAVERKIQRDRKARDRKTKKTAGRAPAPPEPFIWSTSRGPVEVTPEVAAWIETESAEQLGHYRNIARQQGRLAPQRKRWFQEFFERITGPRGFSVHAGTRRTIPKREIPARPRRPWRVVW